MTTNAVMGDKMPSGGKALPIGLGAAQILLAAVYAMAGTMKATQPLEKLAPMLTWVNEFPEVFVRGLGIVELLGAIGLILPALTRIKPKLVAVTAGFIIAHQLCAITLHLTRGEANVLGLNAVLMGLALFIFWGRRRRPIAPRG